MSFVSFAFLVFFAVVLLLQWAIPSRRARQLVLLAASYVFYGWWDWRFMGLMLFVTLSAWLTGLGLARRPGKKGLLRAGIAAPLAVLFCFKYANFFIDAFCLAFRIERTGALAIILPVGISFYTFQSLSYVIDVWRGRISVCRDLGKFALYIAFFPQLVAGPIVKAADFLPQLEEDRRPDGARVFHGLTQFLLGVVKKSVLADHLAVFADAVFGAVGAYSSATVGLAVLAYALQIYLDFSGYSDMALGAARCLGYDLPLNFDLPYLSRSVSEFWKRWHMSLSGWLQQYLYIPLGGNRRGRARTLINLLITMTLGGLWHGANFTFIVWGALHGLALCAHKLFSRRFPARDGLWRRVGATLLTDGFVCLLWVFFRAESLPHALLILRRLFAFAPGLSQLSPWLLAALAFLLTRALLLRRDGAKREAELLPRGTFFGTFAFTLLAGLALILMYTGASPFIYFQF